MRTLESACIDSFTSASRVAGALDIPRVGCSVLCRCNVYRNAFRLQRRNALYEKEETVKMGKWILLVCCLAFAAAPAVAVDVRLDSYRTPKNEKEREFYELYLDGAKSGLMAYNALVLRHGGQPAFCMPDNLALTSERTADIMLRSADKRSAKGDWFVASLLLWGLQDTFPCEKSNSR
jgi:hypothetical protein